MMADEGREVCENFVSYVLFQQALAVLGAVHRIKHAGYADEENVSYMLGVETNIGYSHCVFQCSAPSTV